MAASISFISYVLTYLVLQNFYLVTCILLGLTLFIFVCFSLHESHLYNFQSYKIKFTLSHVTGNRIISGCIGLILGILYAHIQYNYFNNSQAHLYVGKSYDGHLVTISNKSVVVETESKPAQRIRIFLKPDKDFTKGASVQFKCYKILNFPATRFGTFAQLQGIFHSCKGDIRPVKNHHSVLIKLRQSLQIWLDNRLDAFPKDTLARAFLLADTSQIHPNEMQYFRKMGIAHLFSASGLHLGLLFALLYVPFLWLRLPRLGTVLSFCVVSIFIILLDFRLSLLRAYLFVVFYLILNALDRKSFIFHTLFVVAWITEFLQPLSAFSYSFILSFGMTGCILFAFPFVRKLFKLPSRWLSDHVSLTFITFTGSLLLGYYLFQYINPLSFLYNFILTPLAGLYLGLVILSLFIPIFIHGVSILDKLYYYSIKIHDNIWENYFTTYLEPFTHIWIVLISLLILLIIYLAFSNQKWIIKKWQNQVIIVMLLTFYSQYWFVKQPVIGIKAFHYGVLIYKEKNIYALGKLPKFNQKSHPYIFRRPNVPIQSIYTSISLQTKIEKYFSLSSEDITLIPSNNKTFFILNNLCVFFAPKYRKKIPYDSSFASCSHLYIVESKTKNLNLNDLPVLLRNKTMSRVSYYKWHWTMLDDENSLL